MNSLLDELRECVELGKAEKNSPYPPQMKEREGADELTRNALENGISASDILSRALIPAMDQVGKKFSEGKIFVPQMLMSARAMGAAMRHLKPCFQSGEVTSKGTFIIGTVKGDLHDIGKNLVAMMVEGAGWNIIDLGVDVSWESFHEAIKENPQAAIGLSALLTTTMGSMEKIVKNLRKRHDNLHILVGGAPLNNEFCAEIGADFYSPDPKGAVEYLHKINP